MHIGSGFWLDYPEYLHLFSPQRRGHTARSIHMSAELDSNEPMQWIEDLGGRGLDELRDLPFAVSAGMDIAIFE